MKSRLQWHSFSIPQCPRTARAKRFHTELLYRINTARASLRQSPYSTQSALALRLRVRNAFLLFLPGDAYSLNTAALPQKALS